MRFRQAYAVTKSDAVDIRAGDVSDALWIGTPGDGTLSVVMEDGKTVDLKGVAVGVLPLAVKRVRASGSGAADILALKY